MTMSVDFSAEIAPDGAVVLTITRQEGIPYEAPLGKCWSFDGVNGRIVSSVMPAWGRRSLYLRGTDRTQDRQTVRVPMADWPGVADLLWEAYTKGGLLWHVAGADGIGTVPDALQPGLDAAAKKWRNWSPPVSAAPATRPEAFAGTVSATCESTLGGTSRCGKPAVHRIHDTYSRPTRWWSCCATCRNISGLREDGLAVDFSPTAAPPAPKPKPLTVRQQAEQDGVDIVLLEDTYPGWAVGDLLAEAAKRAAIYKHCQERASTATSESVLWGRLEREARLLAKIREEEEK